MAGNIDRLAVIAIPYLTIEYFIVYAFSSQGGVGNQSAWQDILNFFIGAFGGIGGYFSSQLPSVVLFFFLTVHIIMLGIFGAWVYQTINPV